MLLSSPPIPPLCLSQSVSALRGCGEYSIFNGLNTHSILVKFLGSMGIFHKIFNGEIFPMNHY